MDNGLLPHRDGKPFYRVHQQNVRLNLHRLIGQPKSLPGGLEDVDLIDPLRPHPAYPIGHGLFPDPLIEPLPLPFRKLFGIVHPFDQAAGGQQHCRRHHRPCQGAPAHLVRARHQHALLPIAPFPHG